MDLPVASTLTEAELRERRQTIIDTFRKMKVSLSEMPVIQTTERYVKLVPGHAAEHVIEAQRSEDMEIAAFHRRQIGDKNELDLAV